MEQYKADKMADMDDDSDSEYFSAAPVKLTIEEVKKEIARKMYNPNDKVTYDYKFDSSSDDDGGEAQSGAATKASKKEKKIGEKSTTDGSEPKSEDNPKWDPPPFLMSHLNLPTNSSNSTFNQAMTYQGPMTPSLMNGPMGAMPYGMMTCAPGGQAMMSVAGGWSGQQPMSMPMGGPQIIQGGMDPANTTSTPGVMGPGPVPVPMANGPGMQMGPNGPGMQMGPNGPGMQMGPIGPGMQMGPNGPGMQMMMGGPGPGMQMVMGGPCGPGPGIQMGMGGPCGPGPGMQMGIGGPCGLGLGPPMGMVGPCGPGPGPGPLMGMGGPGPGPQMAMGNPGPGPLMGMDGPGPGTQMAMGNPCPGPIMGMGGPGPGPQMVMGGPGPGPQMVMGGPGFGPQMVMGGPGPRPLMDMCGPGPGPQMGMDDPGPRPLLGMRDLGPRPLMGISLDGDYEGDRRADMDMPDEDFPRWVPVVDNDSYYCDDTTERQGSRPRRRYMGNNDGSMGSRSRSARDEPFDRNEIRSRLIGRSCTYYAVRGASIPSISKNAIISKPPQLKTAKRTKADNSREVSKSEPSPAKTTDGNSAKTDTTNKSAVKRPALFENPAPAKTENLSKSGPVVEHSASTSSDPTSGVNLAKILLEHLSTEKKLPTAESSAAFKNDGSFLEVFKKLKENNSEDESKDENNAEKTEKKPVRKPPATIGKRRGGRVLKTGMVEKIRKPETQEEGKPKDAWELYMAEVKKYREANCEEERKTRPLVK